MVGEEGERAAAVSEGGAGVLAEAFDFFALCFCGRGGSEEAGDGGKGGEDDAKRS